MKRRLSILTCTKRRDYLPATVASLERAGALAFDGDRVIYVDGDAMGYAFPGWRVEGLPLGPLHRPDTNELSDGLLGTKQALLEVMRRAWVDGIEMLYYGEDDVAYALNAVPFMIGMAEGPSMDGLGFQTFCDIKQIAVHQGLTTMIGYDFDSPRPGEGGHWGNQALAIPRRTLEHIVQPDPPAWKEFLAKIHYGKPDTFYASDVYIGVIATAPPSTCSEYGVVYPSPAFHSGNASLVLPGAKVVGRDGGPPWGRQTHSYPGDDFDMMQFAWMFRGAPRQRGELPREYSDEKRLRLRFRHGQKVVRRAGIAVLAK